MALLSRQLRFQLVVPLCKPYNPDAAETTPVWAVPLSLATTWGITVVFSSSGYLDVSVLRVSFHAPMYSVRDDRSSTCRVAPFGNSRINARLQLPATYRSLSRPSSPIHAKASSIRPSLLKLCHFTWHEPSPLYNALVNSILYIYSRYAFACIPFALRNNHHIKEHSPDLV